MEATYNLRTENAGLHKVRHINNVEAVVNAFYKAQATYNRKQQKKISRGLATCHLKTVKSRFNPQSARHMQYESSRENISARFKPYML